MRTMQVGINLLFTVAKVVNKAVILMVQNTLYLFELCSVSIANKFFSH